MERDKVMDSRKVVFSILWFLLFSLCLAAKEESPLKVDASISPKRLSRGQEGKITLKISLDKEIAISSQPSFMIEFDSCEEVIFPKNFFTASDLEIGSVEENGEEFLDLAEPIEIPFSVNLDAKRGNHSLQGKIKYFACYKGKGWCLKSSARFSAPFYTRRTVFRKTE